MRILMALIFLIFMIAMLIQEIFYEKFDSGLEAIIIMGLTCTGIYLAWFAITNSFKK